MAGDNTERVGVNAVEAIILNDFNWAFREQPISDFGIDALIEVFEDGTPTGKLIALQIKTGPTYFRKRGTDYVFYGETRHLDYWTTHSLPVFLILHNPESGLTLWQRIERRLAKITKAGWSIGVPASNVLNSKAKRYFEADIAGDEEAVRRFQFAVDLDTMKLFSKHEEVYFRLDRWVNKSLSVRGIQVYFDDKSKAQSDLSFGYWAAGYSNHECMQRWFPWLNYEYAEPVENHSGEVDSHVFLVTLNQHAEAFMKLDEFFRTGEPSQDEQEPPPSDEDSFYHDYDYEYD